jgi:hypothetical protein
LHLSGCLAVVSSPAPTRPPRSACYRPPVTTTPRPGSTEWTRAVWANQLIASRALETVTKRFDAAGIDALAVKGVVTAHTLYSDPAERPLADADVRIRPEDVERAAGIARGAGWHIGAWRPAYGAFVVVVPGLSVPVDVESVIGAPGLCGMSIAEMLTRATRGAGPVDVRVPELHDHAVLMVVNVFKDKLSRAAPWALEDARRIVEVPGFGVDRFVDRVRSAKVVGIAWIVADWMTRQKTSVTWTTVRHALGGAHAPRPVYARLFRMLHERAPEAVATRVLARVGSDDAGMWLGALRKAVALEWRRQLP